jgi:hypothetical protein
MTSDWQKRRSEFNHDWLKNRFLTAVASFMNILDDLVEDTETERSFVGEILPQWPGRAREAARLVADFETQMSPTTLFARPPLCCCGSASASWLPNLVHLLWCRRIGIDVLCIDAARSLADANVAYKNLSEVLAQCADCSSAEALRPFLSHFRTFRSACEKVSGMISRFPSRIELV